MEEQKPVQPSSKPASQREPQDAPPAKIPVALKKWAAIGLVVLLLGPFGVTGYFLYKNKQLNEQIVKCSTKNDLIPNTSVPNTNDQGGQKQVEKDNYLYQRIYPSPDGKYFFALTSAEDNGECQFNISDAGGVNFDIGQLVDFETVLCNMGMGTLSSNSFRGWQGYDSIVLEMLEGELIIINLNTFDKVKHNYDQSVLSVVPGINNPEKTILFKKNSVDDKIPSYAFVDLASNQIVAEVIFEEDNVQAFFDMLNNGFVFIARNFSWDDEQNSETAETIFYFIDANSYEKKVILYNQPLKVTGRGCGPVYLTSQRKGEITINPGGCYVLDTDKFSDNGDIRITL